MTIEQLTTCGYPIIDQKGQQYPCRNFAEPFRYCTRHEEERKALIRFSEWLDGLADGSILFYGRDSLEDDAS
jgi:hypothetical protein